MDLGRRFVTLVFTQPGRLGAPIPSAPAGCGPGREAPVFKIKNRSQPTWAIEATPSAFRFLRFASQMSKSETGLKPCALCCSCRLSGAQARKDEPLLRNEAKEGLGC